MKHKLLKNEVFNYSVHLYIAENKEEYSAIIDKLIKKWSNVTREAYENNEAFFTWNDTERFVVMNNYSVEMAAHEFTHVVFHMLEDRWVPVRRENDEVFCYSLQYFIREYMKFHYKWMLWLKNKVDKT